MELSIIVLAILLGIAVLGLGAILIIQMVLSSKDRRELEKLLKAKNLQEYNYYTPQEEDEVEEEDNLVPIEQVGEYLEKSEKKE